MMRGFIAAFVACGFALAQVPPPPSPPPPPGFAEAAKPLPPGEGGRIEGLVRDTKGQPIARAEVRAQVALDGLPRAPQILTTTTAADGSFAIDGVAPGRVNVFVQRQGFANAAYGQRRFGMPNAPIPIARGETVKDIVIEMVEQGVIAGAITDLSGDPVPNVVVMILRRTYTAGDPRLQPVATATTNDVGEYRVAGLAPGNYYLRAAQRNSGLPGSATGGSESNLTTFYPNAAEERDASPLRVEPGTELRGTNIALRRGRTYSVSGRVQSADGTRVAAPIVAAPEGTLDDLALRLTGLQPTRPDGTFVINGLPPGVYNIQTLTSGNGQFSRRVTIGDKDIADLVLQPLEGVDLKGTVRVEGGDLKSLGRALRISVASPQGGSRSGSVNEDGTFAVNGIAPGPVTVNLGLGSLTENVYLKSKILNGTDVTHSKIELTSSGQVEIVLSTKAASISGVTKSLPGSLVVLLPEAPEAGSRTAIVDRDGKFDIQGLAPGVYTLAVWEEVEPGLAVHRPFVSKFAAKTMKLELAEGEQRAIEPPFIAAEEFRVEEAKLP